MKELVKVYPNAHLQIVGDGCTSARLESLVAKLELQDHVTLVGYVPHHKLPYYYASCDVYVTPSRCELFPLPLLEAWACGKPVVASRIPAHLELLTKSNAGRLYRIGDLKDLCATMIKVYEHKEEYRNSGIHFAKEHDWSEIADRIIKVYYKIL